VPAAARVLAPTPAPAPEAVILAGPPQPQEKPAGAKKEPAPPPAKKVDPAQAKAPAAKVVVKRRLRRAEDELLRQLQNAPALALDRTLARAGSAAAVQATTQALAAGSLNNDATLALLDRRPDLAGLPLRRGAACRLTPEAAAHLAECSAALRGMPRDAAALHTALTDDDPKANRWLRAEAVGVLMQMLTAEAAPVREVLAEQLTRIEARPATEALARLALFDRHPHVRELAITALATRPPGDYRPALLKGFEHPWPAVAENAAEALVALRMREAVPALVRLLDGPDPRAPYRKAGARAPFVKELVRVNHHLNCLLCHPPSFDAEDKVRALVPAITKPLDPPVQGYFAAAPRGPFVRADITYLKQDFSAMLPVANAAPWPAEQRFDFFVRERFATPRDILEGGHRQEAGATEQLRSALFALRELTGQDLGPRVARWKKLVLRRAPDVRLRHRGFRAATALAVDGRGRAYVVDGNRVVRLEGDARREAWLRANGAAALALDGEGRLLAARRDPADVARIDTVTREVTPVASAVAGRPLVGLTCLAADGAGGVYFGEEPGPDGRGGGVLYVSALGLVSKTTARAGRVRGLGLSPDGKALYVARGAGVLAYPVKSPGSLGQGRLLGRLSSRGGQAGAAGLAVDERGLVYVLNGPAAQVEVFGPEGASLPFVRLDEQPVACAVGGGDLYVLTRTALRAVALAAAR
jgi:sugar lactone lactonase YvrE